MRWVLVALCLLLLLTSCRRRPEYKTGEAAYRGECIKCHKLNGEGGSKGPDLTGILGKKDEQYVRTYTVDPRSIKKDGTMPPSRISEHELDLIIEYLKQKGSSH